jgi:FtsP/CotA-like multicopper oxidase with cupredoxin domain
MQRRDFLKAAAVAGVAAAAPGVQAEAQPSAAELPPAGEMQYRQLGRTGEKADTTSASSTIPRRACV